MIYSEDIELRASVVRLESMFEDGKLRYRTSPIRISNGETMRHFSANIGRNDEPLDLRSATNAEAYRDLLVGDVHVAHVVVSPRAETICLHSFSSLIKKWGHPMIILLKNVYHALPAATMMMVFSLDDYESLASSP